MHRLAYRSVERLFRITEQQQVKKIASPDVPLELVRDPLTTTTLSSSSVYNSPDLGDLAMYVGGRWVESYSGARIDVHDPATGAIIATVPDGDATDVDAAVAAARRAFDGEWGQLPPRERSSLLFGVAQIIRRDREDFARLELQNSGKSIGAALWDIDEAAYLFEYYAGWVTKISGEMPPVGTEAVSLIRHEPVGVAGLITPWNFPLLMAAQKVAPALAAGCTCVLKPAEQTPLTALKLAEVAVEVGLPAGALNVLTGSGPSAGAALVEHPGVDKVSFTGSVEVGRTIGATAGRNLKRVTLELGGKSASVVFPDADLDRATEGITAAAFFHQGQVCGACSRVYLHQDVYTEMLGRIKEFVTNLTPGHGLDPSATLGPLISHDQRERVRRYVALGASEGATVAAEGAVPSDATLAGGYFHSPLVLTDVAPQARIAQEEIFGPVMTVDSFADMDDVIGRVNGTKYGLAGSVWTSNMSTALKVSQSIDSGTVWVNDALKAVSEAMWGGVKQSGVGRELGRSGLDAYLEKKQIYINFS